MDNNKKNSYCYSLKDPSKHFSELGRNEIGGQDKGWQPSQQPKCGQGHTNPE